MVELLHHKKYQASSFSDLKEDFIDLSDYKSDEIGGNGLIKMMDVDKYDDISIISKELYNGNIMIVDISSIKEDETLYKKLVADIKKIVADVNGDVAAMKNTYLIITSNGIKISREKIQKEE